ncbi:hypothetical protein MJ1_0577 [Nanobdella aerobiophila]|uniref:Uncharacterized protein n=1 Tax=Nanobdella aerobiophila TaxID=2586965 RepID=A0A915SAF5_9ARCH|nr:hypothetical protein [Nanobdella aerobiophila]BBL45727.1 hypothetical protein MJ1_0577 [Nanobdella aerobiophila]
MEPWEELLEPAEFDYQKGWYTASAVLYAKAIFRMIDYYLYKKYNITVKNHDERKIYLNSKKIIDKVCKELSDIYQSIYEIYISAYYRNITPSEASSLKEWATKIKDMIKDDK